MIELKFRLGIIPFLLLLSAAACRNDSVAEDTPHLYADYYVRYLAPTRQLKAEARFSESADLQAPATVAKPGALTFMGQRMQARTQNGGPLSYRWAGAQPFPDELIFQYQRNDNEYRQEMSLAPLGHFSVQAPVQASRGFTLAAGGSRLKGNETLVVLLADAQRKASSFSIAGPTTDTVHLIPPEAFSDLKAGPATLYLVKRLKKTMTQADQTVTATIEYYTDTLGVKVLE